jgi:hypothetical protein
MRTTAAQVRGVTPHKSPTRALPALRPGRGTTASHPVFAVVPGATGKDEPGRHGPPPRAERGEGAGAAFRPAISTRPPCA